MIEIKNLSKTFQTADGGVDALRDVSITVPDGVIYGIIGMSGAGKSTLVRCINMLERPTQGQVVIDGVDIGALSERELRQKRHEITMIFQGFHLLMQRTVLRNVCFPLELEGVRKAQARQRALELLEMVGLADKANAYPAQLSGGQQQRVAIARALATNPKVLLCDEATSALDPTTTNQILELIRSLQERLGLTVIIITHQMSVVESVCSHVAILDEGSVAEQGAVGEIFASPKSAAAKRLVYPEGTEETTFVQGDGGHYLRVIFQGAASAKTPLIARLARETGVEANISYAATRTVQGKAYGSMLLSVASGQGDLDIAREYLSKEPDVIVEEQAFTK